MNSLIFYLQALYYLAKGKDYENHRPESAQFANYANGVFQWVNNLILYLNRLR